MKGIVLTAKCQSVYFPPFSYNPDSLFPNQTCPSGSFDLSASPLSCSQDGQWLYGQFEFTNTVATEFDLVCEDQYKVQDLE